MIFGEEHDVRAKVVSIQALSAHADRDELLDYFGRMGTAPERAFVVHGELDQAEPFAEALRRRDVRKVTVPEEGYGADL